MKCTWIHLDVHIQRDVKISIQNIVIRISDVTSIIQLRVKHIYTFKSWSLIDPLIGS